MLRQRAVIAACVVLFGALAAFAVVRMRHKTTVHPAAMSPKPETMATAAADAGTDAGRAERFLGVVLAHEAIDVTPRQDGKIRALHVRLGDRVQANGLIASLDTKTIEYDLAMADAAIRAAEAERNKASVELREASERLERRKALAAEAVASAEDLASAGYQKELAQARLDLATAQVREKRARSEQLRQLRSDAELRAPFEGTVAARYADSGANVTATTRIVRLISTKPPFVRFAVPGTSHLRLEKGQGVRVEVEGQTEAIAGTIDTIAPEIDAASRMIIVEATLQRPENAPLLRSGEVARVSLVEARP